MMKRNLEKLFVFFLIVNLEEPARRDTFIRRISRLSLKHSIGYGMRVLFIN